MLTLTFKAADRFAECLDFFRSRALRITLYIKPLRPFFYVRSRRLLLLFAIAAISSLTLSLLFPLWVLLIGPLVWGVPHIFSSLRYFHHSVGADQPKRPRSFFIAASMILCCVFTYRLLFNSNLFNLNLPQMSEWKGSTFLELLALGVTFIGGAALYRKSWKKILIGLALLVPFTLVFVRFTAPTVGALVLIHNGVAFIYWIRAAKTRPDRRTAWIAFTTTLFLHALIFWGAFDRIFPFMAPKLFLNFADLSIADTGQMIAPWSENPALWLHVAVAFAFGQALHYFVWLKAIPDQFHYHEVPTSFRQSLGLLRSDFGKIGTLLLISLSVGSVVIWSLLSFQQARLIYFCLASYHGYLEIAGLGLMI